MNEVYKPNLHLRADLTFDPIHDDFHAKLSLEEPLVLSVFIPIHLILNSSLAAAGVEPREASQVMQVASHADDVDRIRTEERQLFERRHRSLLLHKLKLPPSTHVEFQINEHLERSVSVNYGEYFCFALHEDGPNFNCKKRDGSGLSTGNLNGSQSDIVSRPEGLKPNCAQPPSEPAECQWLKTQF